MHYVKMVTFYKCEKVGHKDACLVYVAYMTEAKYKMNSSVVHLQKTYTSSTTSSIMRLTTDVWYVLKLQLTEKLATE